jgi:hypothetical protein
MGKAQGFHMIAAAGFCSVEGIIQGPEQGRSQGFIILRSVTDNDTNTNRNGKLKSLSANNQGLSDDLIPDILGLFQGKGKMLIGSQPGFTA